MDQLLVAVRIRQRGRDVPVRHLLEQRQERLEGLAAIVAQRRGFVDRGPHEGAMSSLPSRTVSKLVRQMNGRKSPASPRR
jgi:hypothetical protein